MRKVFVRIFGAAAAICACACSTPDGDDIDDLAAGIRGLPLEDQATVSANKENDRLWAILRNKDAPNGNKIGTVTCQERDLPEFQNYARRDPWVTKEWLLQELRHNPTWGLTELFASVLRNFTPGPLGGHPCTPVFRPWPGFRFDELKAELDAAEQAEDEAEDSAFWLPTLSTEDMTSRPVLLGVLGLAVVGGVIVISVSNPVIMALCPKSTAVPCPGNPTTPGQDPVIVPGGEGDR